MPISPKILKAHGCDPKLWKELFVAERSEKLPQIKKLELLIQNRVCDGQLRCISEWPTYAAIDVAFDVPFAQTTPTIIQHLTGRKWDKMEDMMAELERWGVREDELFLTMKDEKGRSVKVPNPPTFVKVFVPLVKAYVTIRWARLFNDRNTSPLLKYEPIQSNAEHRLLCEIMTYIVQVITADYGYPDVLKDVIHQTLMYAACLAFPREVWHREKQIEEDDDGNEEVVIQKEGIRYNLPHPSLMFYDLSYPASTFNSGTGCEFAGYWKAVKYGELLDNPQFWNRRQIGYSGNRWFDPLFTNNFFANLFPCRLQFPTPPVSGDGTNRENNMAFYTTAERDMAVTLTDLYMRIVPKRYKLGTYNHPIWVRFVVASDNTVVYAEPCCYNPILYAGYDSNQLRSKNSSLALEVLPFQDIVGNCLSQILLTMKQNLLQVVFYDKNQIDKRQVDDLKNRGELLLRSINFLEFDSLKVSRLGVDPEKSIVPMKFQNQDVMPMFSTINTVLMILERMLQMSSQESGAAGPHQQSKAEVELLNQETDNRVKFTGSFIDSFIDAWKQQQHDAALAYLTDPIEALVSSDIPDVESSLKALGFEVTNKIKGQGSLKISGSKKGIKIDALAISHEGPEKKDDTKTAQVLMQTVMAISKNADLMKLIGAKGLLKIIEKAAVLAGADKDFKLKPDQSIELDSIRKMAEQIQIACAKQAEDKIGKPAAQQIVAIKNEIKTIDAVLQKLITAVQAKSPGPGAPPVAPPAPPPPVQPLPPNAPQTQPPPVAPGPPGAA